MNLPQEFIQTIRGVFGEEGDTFLEHLPDLIAEASDRWGLSGIEPVPNLSYNFVAFARRGKADLILKLCVPNREVTSEIAALKLFNGEGACRLIGHDEEKCLLLLERLKPGESLSTLEEDAATRIAVQVMQRLWRAAPDSDKLIHLSDWFNGLKKIRPRYAGGTGPFPKPILERVESILPELFADQDIKLMHGDFHHFNVLSSERGWLAIDPKGVVGPAGYEIGPFMLNPLNSITDARLFKARAKRRISILEESLGWERQQIIRWSTAHAVLSAWWDLEGGTGWEYSMHCAELFSELE